MHIKISMKDVKKSKSVEEQIEKKSSRLVKYFEKDVRINWHCHEKASLYYTDISVSGVGGKKYTAKAHHENLYKSFDLSLDKIEKQLLKLKEKTKNVIHKRKNRIEVEAPVPKWEEHYPEIKKAS